MFVKLKHIFYAAVHITLRSRTRGLLLYARAARVILENCHSLISEILKYLNENTDLPSLATHYVKIHAGKLKDYHKHLSIAHLSTQSTSSTFDKFQAMIN